MNDASKIPACAIRRVPRIMSGQLRQAVADHEWPLALLCVSSESRISLCMDLWCLIPDSDKPGVLADAISGGDNPAREYFRLSNTLSEFHRKGIRVFDADLARREFETLPAVVPIYRGTVEAEGDAYGVCWTLSRETAAWFARKHGRFRNRQSPPVILSSVVKRHDIGGLLLERDEKEVLIWLGNLKTVQRAALE